MVFSDPVIVICEECQGKRYNEEALSYRYNGKSIATVLSMTSKEASRFFDNQTIIKRLSILDKVGTGYITLGQATSTLSGGEIQRMKIASKLKSKNNLILLDEPTNGLHMADVVFLMQLLRSIVNEGNTVIFIEHDKYAISVSDWIIDMGTDGGRFGGNILFEGIPQDVVKCSHS